MNFEENTNLKNVFERDVIYEKLKSAVSYFKNMYVISKSQCDQTKRTLRKHYGYAAEYYNKYISDIDIDHNRINELIHKEISKQQLEIQESYIKRKLEIQENFRKNHPYLTYFTGYTLCLYPAIRKVRITSISNKIKKQDIQKQYEERLKQFEDDYCMLSLYKTPKYLTLDQMPYFMTIISKKEDLIIKQLQKNYHVVVAPKDGLVLHQTSLEHEQNYHHMCTALSLIHNQSKYIALDNTTMKLIRRYEDAVQTSNITQLTETT